MVNSSIGTANSPESGSTDEFVPSSLAPPWPWRNTFSKRTAQLVSPASQSATSGMGVDLGRAWHYLWHNGWLATYILDNGAVMARRLHVTGVPNGDPFTVDNSPNLARRQVQVRVLDGCKFLFTWIQGKVGFTPPYQVVARLMDGSRNFLTASTILVTSPTLSIDESNCAPSQKGFACIWRQRRDIMVRYWNSNLGASSPLLTLKPSPSEDIRSPNIVVGEQVALLTWNKKGSTGWSIWGQEVDQNARTTDPAWRINQFDCGDQAYPHPIVSGQSVGVVWSGQCTDRSSKHGVHVLNLGSLPVDKDRKTGDGTVIHSDDRPIFYVTSRCGGPSQKCWALWRETEESPHEVPIVRAMWFNLQPTEGVDKYDLGSSLSLTDHPEIAVGSQGALATYLARQSPTSEVAQVWATAFSPARSITWTGWATIAGMIVCCCLYSLGFAGRYLRKRNNNPQNGNGPGQPLAPNGDGNGDGNGDE